MVLKKIKIYLKERFLAGKYPCHDLREEGTGPVEAYYSHQGAPCIITIDLDKCRWIGASALSYSRDSLHPYIRTLIQYEEGNCLTYDESYLKTYWETWQPANIAEMLGLNPDTSHPLLLNTPPMHNIMPWAGTDRIEFMQDKVWLTYPGYKMGDLETYPPARSCGPKPAPYGKKAFHNLIAVYLSIRDKTYRKIAPDYIPYSEQHINAACMLHNKEVRYIITHGQHRAASLAVLNQSRVPAIVHSLHDRSPAVIRREDVDNWPLVTRGIFTAEDAIAIFDRIFDGIPPKIISDL